MHPVYSLKSAKCSQEQERGEDIGRCIYTHEHTIKRLYSKGDGYVQAETSESESWVEIVIFQDGLTARKTDSEHAVFLWTLS